MTDLRTSFNRQSSQAACLQTVYRMSPVPPLVRLHKHFGESGRN